MFDSDVFMLDQSLFNLKTLLVITADYFRDLLHIFDSELTWNLND